MIPRHQTVFLIVLLLASAAMGTVLWKQFRRAHERLLRGEVAVPTEAPQVAPDQPATLMVASDADNSVEPRVLTLPLPQNPEARARALLGKLFEMDAAPDATHPVPGGPSSIAQVFLLPIPEANGKIAADPPLLAVVNFTGSFAGSHPSGIEAETLTIRSICATLNANLPRIEQVRFLVDGQPRPTLAGHADLTRTYLASPSGPNGETQP